MTGNEMTNQNSSERTVLVDQQGVRFGPNCWLSHEQITGKTAEQLNKGSGIVSREYVRWLNAAVAHPPAAEVDKAMVERACKVAVEHCWPDYYDDMDDLRAMMQAALTAARLPAVEVREVDEAMVGRAQTAWYAAGSAPCSTARDWMRAALIAALQKEKVND